MLWQVESGRPTTLVPLTVMIWSPMFSLPDLAAGPPCIRLAMMTVGRMEPQPDSTITTPRISPFCFSMYTWHKHISNTAAVCSLNTVWCFKHTPAVTLFSESHMTAEDFIEDDKTICVPTLSQWLLITGKSVINSVLLFNSFNAVSVYGKVHIK